MGGERHRSVWAQSGRFGGLGMGFARSWLLLRGPMVIPGSVTRRGRAWLRGVPGVQETARSAVSCTGLRGASREIAPSSKGFAASARNPALNNCNIRAKTKEPPHWAGGESLSLGGHVGNLNVGVNRPHKEEFAPSADTRNRRIGLVVVGRAWMQVPPALIAERQVQRSCVNCGGDLHWNLRALAPDLGNEGELREVIINPSGGHCSRLEDRLIRAPTTHGEIEDCFCNRRFFRSHVYRLRSISF